MNNEMKEAAEKLAKALTRLKEIKTPRRLAKNEMEVAAFADGKLSMEFGSEITDEVRNSAVTWLSDKGFLLSKTAGDTLSFVKAGVSCPDCAKDPNHAACLVRKRLALI